MTANRSMCPLRLLRPRPPSAAISLAAISLALLSGFQTTGGARAQEPAKSSTQRGSIFATANIDADALKRLLANKAQRVVLLDVRSEQEFLVSHIAGATRLPPGTEPAEFWASSLLRFEGATVVMYCTTGARSTPGAGLYAPELRGAGAVAVLHLNGGIIAWANAGGALVDRVGATQLVHPFMPANLPLFRDRAWASNTPMMRQTPLPNAAPASFLGAKPVFSKPHRHKCGAPIGARITCKF